MADFRPALHEIEEFERTGTRSWRPVPGEWREKKALASATVKILSGDLPSLDDVSLRGDLEYELARFLLDHGVKHLDMDVIQGSDREVTQVIARTLFSWGVAGVLYRSKYDNEICAALFEGRAQLIPQGEAISLTEPLAEFTQVCREFRLD